MKESVVENRLRDRVPVLVLLVVYVWAILYLCPLYLGDIASKKCLWARSKLKAFAPVFSAIGVVIFLVLVFMIGYVCEEPNGPLHMITADLLSGPNDLM